MKEKTEELTTEQRDIARQARNAYQRELIDALSAVPRRAEAINLYDFGRKIRDEETEIVESAFYAVSKIKNRLPER